MKKISISVLTRGYDNLFNYNPLIERNNLIFEHIIEPSKLSFDVHIFHEGNISEEHQLYIKNLSKPKLIFKNVKELSENFAFDDSKNIMNFPIPCFTIKIDTINGEGYWKKKSTARKSK